MSMGHPANRARGMSAPPVGNDVPCPEPPRVSIVNRQESLTPITACPGRLVSQYSDSLLVDILSVPRGNSKRRKELKQLRPPQEIIEAMYNDHEMFWEGLREHIPAMSESLGSEPADRMAAQHRYQKGGGHTLFRPVGQEAFARALRILLDREVPIQQGIKALASTQLMLDQAPWPHVMWDPSRNAMNRTNLQLAESLLLYMVHEDPVNSSFKLEAAYQTAVRDPLSRLAEIPKGQPAR